MGNHLQWRFKNNCEMIVLVEKDDDRIVLVEQMWKYKRDFSRFIGVRHGFVVTTTAKGKKTKRDIILDSTKEGRTRVMDYGKHSHDDFVYKRIKVEPIMTEEELQARLDQGNTFYDLTENNCWHYSHRIVDNLQGKSSLHPYLRALQKFKSGVSPFMSNEKIKEISKIITNILV